MKRLLHRGLGSKTGLYLVLLIYWVIISMAPFFTVELKVTKGYSVRLSPHQISFHVRHKKNTFILVSCSLKLGHYRLYPGSQILELNYAGLKLDPLVQGLRACALKLESL